MKRAIVPFGVISLIFRLPIAGQNLPDSSYPTFDLASVKASGSAITRVGPGEIGYSRLKPFRYIATRLSCDLSLTDILIEAFSLEGRFRLEGPSWISQEAYAITANMPEGTSKEKARLMLRTMLKERFGLRFHWQSKKLPVYALVESKGGAKLEEVSELQKVKPVSISTPIGALQGQSIFTAGHYMANAGSIDVLAANLSSFMDRPVVNMTGFKGAYHIDLQWDPHDSDSLGNPGLMAAMDRQLGLKLNRQDLPLAILVVDHIEKTPTKN